MRLDFGCMRAHDDMGNPGINITYEDIELDLAPSMVDQSLDSALLAQRG